MKVLVCGSRTINDPAVVSQAIEQSGIRPTSIISGGARGVDRLAGEYAASHGIEFTEYLADWDRFGKRAGFLRNYVMVGEADAVIAVWDGKSSGTKHAIDTAISSGKQVFVYQHRSSGAEVAAASATGTSIFRN
ncbi:MAG: DUF2493 domain-containing protein [Acidobacteria bacterium]|nr:DUF2493 domain-containing protein [Acidobacteriota bacterium]